MDKQTDESLLEELKKSKEALQKALANVDTNEKAVRSIHLAQRNLLKTRKWVPLERVAYGFEFGDEIFAFDPTSPADIQRGKIKRYREDCTLGTLAEDGGDSTIIFFQLIATDPTQPQLPDATGEIKTGRGVLVKLIKQSPIKIKVKKEDLKDALDEVILD